MKYLYKAHVTSVYDGDTCTVDIDLGFGIIFKKQKIRFFGINTPELRGGTEETKQAGRDARDEVRRLILDREIQLETIKDKKGKYGRLLGIIHIEHRGSLLNVNDWLVMNGHAEAKKY